MSPPLRYPRSPSRTPLLSLHHLLPIYSSRMLSGPPCAPRQSFETGSCNAHYRNRLTRFSAWQRRDLVPNNGQIPWLSESLFFKNLALHFPGPSCMSQRRDRETISINRNLRPVTCASLYFFGENQGTGFSAKIAVLHSGAGSAARLRRFGSGSSSADPWRGLNRDDRYALRSVQRDNRPIAWQRARSERRAQFRRGAPGRAAAPHRGRGPL